MLSSFLAEFDCYPFYIFLNCPVYHCTTQHSRISSEILVRRTILCLFSCGLVYVSPDFEHIKAVNCLSTECHYLPACMLLFSMWVFGFLFVMLLVKLYFLSLPVKCFVLSVAQKAGFSETFQSCKVEYSFSASWNFFFPFFVSELWR